MVRSRRVRIGALEVDLDGRQVRVTGQVIKIPLKEFDLLATLVTSAGHVLTRRELLDQVWEPGYPDGTKALEVHIQRLRSRLAPDSATRARLRTVRSLGYVFDLEE